MAEQYRRKRIDNADGLPAGGIALNRRALDYNRASTVSIRTAYRQHALGATLQGVENILGIRAIRASCVVYDQLSTTEVSRAKE